MKIEDMLIGYASRESKNELISKNRYKVFNSKITNYKSHYEPCLQLDPSSIIISSASIDTSNRYITSSKIIKSTVVKFWGYIYSLISSYNMSRPEDIK